MTPGLRVGGLDMPDLRPHFRHLHWRTMGHSMGVAVASDWSDRASNDPLLGLYKQCGLWTLEEAAILFSVARQVQGDWLDLGAHTGWTAAYQAAAGCNVIAVDNMLGVPEFAQRFEENTAAWRGRINPFAGTTEEFFEFLSASPKTFSGVVIDADHEPPWPLTDALQGAKHLADDGVLLFHDFIGRPVRDGVRGLLELGFQCRVYSTPHMVACCWRGKFQPPDHTPNARIDWEAVRGRMTDFPFEGCL